MLTAKRQHYYEATCCKKCQLLSHQIDQFDIGIHVFTGTARAPFLKSNGEGTSHIPIYQKLTQGGVDIQRTWDAWLLKLEVVIADQSGDNFTSNVFGLEYTFFDFSNSGIDIGILFEGLYDNRDENKTASTLFENDIFVGAVLHGMIFRKANCYLVQLLIGKQDQCLVQLSTKDVSAKI